MLIPALLAAVLAQEAVHLQELVDAAIREGKPRLVIPAGIHRLPKSDGTWCLLVRDAKDLEIDARGAEFVIADPRNGGIQFLRCRNVRLRGLSLRHETPPFTQGRIDAVGGKSIDVRLHAGYPDLAERPTGYVFDPKTRRIKDGTFDLTATQVERLEPHQVRLHFAEKAAAVEVGDLIAFRGHVVQDLHVAGCAAMAIEDVTIRNGGGFVVHEDGGEGGSRYRFKVTYGSPPPGAAESPLLACNADAFHSSGVRRGPTLDGCEFEGMGDDGAAIHGAYALIVEAREKSWVVTDGVLREGDPLRLFNPDGGFVGEAKVVSVRRLKEFTPAGKSRFHGFADLSKTRFAEVTTEPPLAAGFDWQASNPASIGSGYVVRNSTIRNHRARGLLLKADDGLVEGNTIEGSSIAGMVLAPELWWREACYSRNVVIRNNTIRRCGTSGVSPWTTQAGALSVTAETKPGALPGHRNLVIENNRFIDNDGINLLLQAVDGVQVRGNRFEGAGRLACKRGSARRMDSSALIWLSQCRNVRFGSNLVLQPGAALSRLVGVGEETENLVGLDSGLSSER